MTDFVSHPSLTCSHRESIIKFCGSGKLTGGAPGLQIRCNGQKLLGGFDFHALTPKKSKGIVVLAIPFFTATLRKHEFLMLRLLLAKVQAEAIGLSFLVWI